MFIVIDVFDRTYPSIVTDENGMPMLFDTEAEAQAEADDCQDGCVFEY